MIDLLIAGVRCRLEPESGDFVFAPKLMEFRNDGSAPDLRLHLGVVPGWREAHADLTEMPAQRQGDHFEFLRRNGALTATGGFADCRAGLDPREQVDFDGQPWLMLALWGYHACRGGLFLHGACCEFEGRRVLLLGKPQVGKSTLSRLLVDAGGACLTDEYPFVTRETDGFVAHGTPWPGRQGAPASPSGPLAAIFFLRQAPANELQRLDRREAIRRLLANHRFFRWAPETHPPAFEQLAALATAVPVWDYGFAPTPAAVAALAAVR